MKPFQFKQFSVNQEHCAMKIGTDGVLLGAWSKIDNHPRNILDIGAGTGVISLMLAQRSDAPAIDALEIDPDAYEQSVDNFENSPWDDRLFCYHAEFTEFVAEMFEEEETYDIIVSNPPFYTEEVSSGNSKRDQARMSSSLPFEDLIEGTSLILSENGIFNVVIPNKEETTFIQLASQFELFPFEIMRVKGTGTSEIKRSLLAFSFEQKDPEFSELIIETERHQYTDAYKELVKDFYLKM
ncbi:methyltransferase [Mangrovimonas sp. AS39]|uniref:tRNA1(Val) (adenine(37)-N6)-methyltransferase n=1 Tax=Mangrovimonas futianensis TaxID=2895523 RepID=UPI001E3574E6|nr:methyltransferase [Mangrovimonas futianensis]MCF1191062.1 methyltransferase [Mangrovimonas futianensis]MCF1194757.1 methyltransferase [Mangrovimonas futianensis]